MSDNRYKPGRSALDMAAAYVLPCPWRDGCKECEIRQRVHDQIRALPSGDWEDYEQAVEAFEAAFDLVYDGTNVRHAKLAGVRAVLAGPGGGDE